MSRPRPSLGTVVLLLITGVLLVLPMFTEGFFLEFVVTKSLIWGVAAATLIFLAANGGTLFLSDIADMENRLNALRND